jgi:hypothetical protein
MQISIMMRTEECVGLYHELFTFLFIAFAFSFLLVLHTSCRHNPNICSCLGKITSLYVSSEVFTAVTMNNAVFWNVMP